MPPDSSAHLLPHGNATAYRRWRDAKLAARPRSVAELYVDIDDLTRPSAAELGALRAALARANLALYRARHQPTRGDLLPFCARLGLHRLVHNPESDDDGLSAIAVRDEPRRGEFIPYTDRAIGWHTDGYYNPPERRIRAFLLHCVRPAAAGGESRLLDPELLYIRLRDEDPALVAALMHPAAMTIPAHEQDGVVMRPAVSGPVFAVDAVRGVLEMRYTARTRSIRWRDDAVTRAAVARIETLLGTGDDTLGLRLAAGEGVVCNNVLHARAAFHDEPPGRLLYRARFLDRTD